jgi:hypothetical protein
MIVGRKDLIKLRAEEVKRSKPSNRVASDFLYLLEELNIATSAAERKTVDFHKAWQLFQESEKKLNEAKKFILSIKEEHPHWDLCSAMNPHTTEKFEAHKCDCYIIEATEMLKKLE